jgi:hypothetical protein
MDVNEAISLELKVRSGQFGEITSCEWVTVISAFAELFPECFYDYMRPDGIVEKRSNVGRLPTVVMIEHLAALSQNERTGRIRKDV